MNKALDEIIPATMHIPSPPDLKPNPLIKEQNNGENKIIEYAAA